jgi:hypothetical protein
MQNRGRSLYNLLRARWIEDPTLQVQPWQVEDYRCFSTEDLFARLHTLGLPLDKERLLLYAETCDSPEELTDCLWLDDASPEGFEQAYLLLFELWRRLLPHNRPLSVFCDELDRLIDLYDAGAQEDEEPLQGMLAELEDILDAQTDQGENPKELFQIVTSYCAHDLEEFLADYIADQIEAGEEVYASELIDGFYAYIAHAQRFDFLRACLFFSTDGEEAGLMVRRILEQLQEEPDWSLLTDICRFLVHTGERSLFTSAIHQAKAHLKKEEDLQELLHIVADYYCCLDKEQEEASVRSLLRTRAAKHPHSPIGAADLRLLDNYV